MEIFKNQSETFPTFISGLYFGSYYKKNGLGQPLIMFSELPPSGEHIVATSIIAQFVAAVNGSTVSYALDLLGSLKTTNDLTLIPFDDSQNTFIFSNLDFFSCENKKLILSHLQQFEKFLSNQKNLEALFSFTKEFTNKTLSPRAEAVIEHQKYLLTIPLRQPFFDPPIPDTIATGTILKGNHDVKIIRVGDKAGAVDVEIADLVELLLQKGYTTVSSCKGRDYPAHIGIQSLEAFNLMKTRLSAASIKASLPSYIWNSVSFSINWELPDTKLVQAEIKRLPLLQKEPNNYQYWNVTSAKL